MVKRLSERTVKTESVQGEGSFVSILPLTVGEILGIQRERETRQSPWYKVGRIWGWIRRLFRRASAADMSEQLMLDTIGKVAGWNWVDARGNPLPQPKDEPNVVFQLTNDEYTAIHNAVYGLTESEEQKN